MYICTVLYVLYCTVCTYVLYCMYVHMYVYDLLVICHCHMHVTGTFHLLHMLVDDYILHTIETMREKEEKDRHMDRINNLRQGEHTHTHTHTHTTRMMKYGHASYESIDKY